MGIKSLLPMYVVVITWALSRGTNISQPFQNLQMNATPVVFEKIGRAVFYKEVWTILTKFTPLDYSTVLDIADTYDEKIEQLCGLVKENTATATTGFKQSCLLMVKETSVINNNIRKTNEQIKRIFVKNRSKRAIEAVGTFAKWAFGTMDTEDAHKIYNQLAILEKNDAKNFDLIKHQITVMGSNFNKLSAPIKGLVTDVDAIAKNLREFSASYGNFTMTTKDEITTLKLKSEINELLSIINAQLLEVHHRQSTELSILNDLYMNKLHPFIIDSHTITDTLKRLSTTTSIQPFFQNFFTLHQAAQVSVFQDDKSLLIKVKIPLPDPITYSVHRVYPLTSILNQNWDVLPSISVEYIAEATNQASFVLLTHEDYTNCVSVAANTTTSISVCQYNKPILTTGTTECVVELFQHTTSSEENCKYVAVPTTEGVLIKMAASNQWLYNIKTPLTLNIDCDGLYYTAILKGIGILKILQACEVSSKQIRLPYEKVTYTQTSYKKSEIDHSRFFQSLKLKLKTLNASNDQLKTYKPSNLKIGNHKEILTILADGRKSIEDLQGEVNRAIEARTINNNEWELTVHRVSLFSMSSLILILLIIGAVILISRRKNNRKSEEVELNVTNITTGTPYYDQAENISNPITPPKLLRTASRKSTKRPSNLTFACV